MSADEAEGPTGHDPRGGTLTTIPPEMVIGLHRGLYAELTRACEDAPQAITDAETRADWVRTLGRIAAAVDALDVMGWDEPTGEQPVTISLSPIFIEVMERDVEHDYWLAEQTNELAEGRTRAAERAATVERFLASLPALPTPLLIPTAAIPLVRECAQEGIPTVAEAIDHAEVDVREGTRRLNAIADLLDAIGWTEDEEPAEDVDATEHANAVREVLPPLLDTLKTAVSDAPDDEAKRTKGESELRLLSEVYAHANEVPGS
jgi:hypothetical protein